MPPATISTSPPWRTGSAIDVPQPWSRLDRYYADQLGADGRRVATQVARQLAEPRPDDLGEVDLISYRRLDRYYADQLGADGRRVATQVARLATSVRSI